LVTYILKASKKAKMGSRLNQSAIWGD